MAGSLLPTINGEFEGLDQGGKVFAEYVWIGGTGKDIRSKTKVLNAATALADLPIWNYDGSSTAQAPGQDSEVLLKPCAVFKDPFRGGENILVLCETMRPLGEGKMEPLTVPGHDLESSFGVNGNNNRAIAQKIFEDPKVKAQKPWFGIEQEYTLFHKNKRTPLGWPEDGFPAPQGPYYCSAGVGNSFGRDIAESHMKACIYAGITVSGINAEVMPGQWEYQVGPCEGIDSGDHMWMSRYIMERVAEKYGVFCTFEPKPMSGDWNGAGCHTNYSTEDMRNKDTSYEYTPEAGPYKGQALKGGFAKIIEACERLRPKHAEHIQLYGPDNDLRLTGKHETADINTFSYGVANRGASIRIPRDTEGNGYGYMEDRRPSSNIDVYVVTSKIAKTTILEQ